MFFYAYLHKYSLKTAKIHKKAQAEKRPYNTDTVCGEKSIFLILQFTKSQAGMAAQSDKGSGKTGVSAAGSTHGKG